MRILLAVFAFLGLVSTASATTLVEQVDRLVTYVSDPTEQAGALLYKSDDVSDVTVVFVNNGNRYTISYSKEITMLVISVRPDGTTRPTPADSFLDKDLDGGVDHANHVLEGPVLDKNNPKWKWFDNGWSSEPIGLQYEAYWQNRFNEAVHDALAFYER